MRTAGYLISAALLLFAAGCGALGALLALDDTVTVALVNNGDYAVEVTLFYGDQQEIPEALLTSIGERIERTVAAGDTATLTRDCDDLQAIVIDDADLRVIGAVGPEASTAILRDGDDFGCGDHIIFTFDHSAAITDFGISVEIR